MSVTVSAAVESLSHEIEEWLHGEALELSNTGIVTPSVILVESCFV